MASNANWAYMSQSASSDPANIIGIGAALLLILVTGYLIIYNIFQISVIRDIRYYGLLKTIGTTGRQIKKILRRQASRFASWAYRRDCCLDIWQAKCCFR